MKFEQAQISRKLAQVIASWRSNEYKFAQAKDLRWLAFSFDKGFTLAYSSYYYWAYLFLNGVESITQNRTTEELNTSPSNPASSLEGVLRGVR